MILEVLWRVFFYSIFVITIQEITRRVLPLSVLLLLMFTVFNFTAARSQVSILKNIHDTNYIFSYTEDFTARTFTSVSFVGVSLRDINIDKSLNY